MAAAAGALMGGGASLLTAIGGLLPSTTTTSTSGQSNKATSQVMLDQTGMERMLNLILQGTDGLQSVASGERTAGIFNSTTNEQLVNDLLVRAAGTVAVAAAPTVQTQDMGPTTTTAKSSKGCFITTAICEHMMKPDDCEELEVLRDFRDSWMMNHGKSKEIAEYYRIAPLIVKAIDTHQAKDLILGFMYLSYIKPAVESIKNQEFEVAYNTYVQLFNYAKKITRIGV